MSRSTEARGDRGMGAALSEKAKMEAEPKKKRSTFQKSEFMQISSHGRRRDRRGAVGWGGVQASGYRTSMNIGLERNGRVIKLPPHTLAHVYANDLRLEKWTKAKKRGGGTPPTVDHKNQDRADNHYWNLDWATWSEQMLNRTVTEEAKASERSKKSKGRVQAREWTGCVVERYGRATGGTANEWDVALVFVGQHEAARHTGQDHCMIGRWLDDDKSHFCKATDKFWEYRSVLDEVDADEEWRPVPGFEESGAQVSNLGRVKTKKTQASRGSRSNGVYRNIRIDGKRWTVHELVGYAFFGPRPGKQHTIDHKHPSVYDDEGCLSNAPEHLVNWATKSQQTTTSTNGSMAATQGKRVRAVDKTTKEATEYTDTRSAAAGLGLNPGFVAQVCRGVVNSKKYEMSFVEEPNLVHTRVVVVDGKEVEVEDVERWFDVDPADWDVGGKYHCVRHAPAKRNAQPSGKKRKAEAEPES